MKATEIKFSEGIGVDTNAIEFYANESGETTIHVRLGANEDYNRVISLEKDDARMIVEFLKTVFVL